MARERQTYQPPDAIGQRSITLTLRLEPPFRHEGTIRLRGALKCLLRGFGWRVVDMRTDPPMELPADLATEIVSQQMEATR